MFDVEFQKTQISKVTLLVIKVTKISNFDFEFDLCFYFKNNYKNTPTEIYRKQKKQQ